VLPVDLASIRLFLHVLAASVWVGGQLTLAGVVPALRPAGRDVVRGVARAFQRIAWPAFAVLIATGVWNLVAIDAAQRSRGWWTTLLVKLTLVATSGLAAGLHVLVLGPAVHRAPDAPTRRRAAAASGIAESVSLLAALGAMLLGVVLAG
jgi:putative copper export protein